LYWALLGNSVSNPKFRVIAFISSKSGFSGGAITVINHQGSSQEELKAGGGFKIKANM